MPVLQGKGSTRLGPALRFTYFAVIRDRLALPDGQVLATGGAEASRPGSSRSPNFPRDGDRSSASSTPGRLSDHENRRRQGLIDDWRISPAGRPARLKRRRQFRGAVYQESSSAVTTPSPSSPTDARYGSTAGHGGGDAAPKRARTAVERSQRDRRRAKDHEAPRMRHPRDCDRRYPDEPAERERREDHSSPPPRELRGGVV